MALSQFTPRGVTPAHCIMPTLTRDITPTTDRLPTIVGDDVAPGNLFTLVAFILEGSSTTGRTAIQVCTYQGAPIAQNILSVLIDDYVYDGHSPAWDGFIPIEEGEGVLAIVRSSDAVVVRVVGKTLKHDPLEVLG